jgi:hypothetical protein
MILHDSPDQQCVSLPCSEAVPLLDAQSAIQSTCCTADKGMANTLRGSRYLVLSQGTPKYYGADEFQRSGTLGQPPRAMDMQWYACTCDVPHLQKLDAEKSFITPNDKLKDETNVRFRNETHCRC